MPPQCCPKIEKRVVTLVIGQQSTDKGLFTIAMLPYRFPSITAVVNAMQNRVV
jgi:hypothetical protein